MTLKFGKHKGKQFKNTPLSYQNWLLSQDWFKAPKEQLPLHRQSLNGWDDIEKLEHCIMALENLENKEDDKYL